MNKAAELTFNAPAPVVWLGAVAMLAVIVLAVLAWRRSDFQPFMGMLELLRVVLVGLAVITLCQPEWQEKYLPENRPVVCVLWDQSKSTDTRDVLLDSDTRQPPMTRRQWIDQQLKGDYWEALRESVDIVQQPFSTTESVPGTDINAALEDVLAKYNNLRALVMLSDGDWNTGQSPLTAATKLRMKSIPVFTVPVGSETPLPDVEILSLEPPTFSVVGKSLQIPFTIRSRLPQDYKAVISLDVDSGEALKKEVLIPAMGQAQDVFFWTPEKLGVVTMKLEVPVHEDEAVPENNQKSVDVKIRAESLKVLVVESLPRWEYRYLRNALERDPGVEVSCLLFHPHLQNLGGGKGYLKKFPDSLEKLAEYDVVFLGDVGVGNGQLTVEQCGMLKGLVQQQASGLVFIPGMRGGHLSLLSTELEELYPVVLDSANPRGFGSAMPTRFLLTQAGRSNLLTKLADTEKENIAVWRGLPGCQWRSPARRGKAGSDVLAIDEKSRAPLLVTKTYGTGKILFIGTDGAWRWREGVEDKYHYRFWGQVARWMAYQRHMAEGEMLRMFYLPDRPQPNSTVTLNATVLDPSGVPFLGGAIAAEITSPTGNTERVRFLETRGEWGLYVAKFKPAYPGSYKVKLQCKETSAILETEVVVQGQDREKIGQPARKEVLQEIADVTRGELVPTQSAAMITEKVLALPDIDPLVKRYQIWASPLWAGMIISLLGLFWVGRKWKGTI